MPRTKPLVAEDPGRIAVREKVFSVMGALNITQSELAKLTGIKRSTLSKRIGKHGDIGTLRLDEFLAIKRLAE